MKIGHLCFDMLVVDVVLHVAPTAGCGPGWEVGIRALPVVVICHYNIVGRNFSASICLVPVDITNSRGIRKRGVNRERRDKERTYTTFKLPPTFAVLPIPLHSSLFFHRPCLSSSPNFCSRLSSGAPSASTKPTTK